METNRTLDGHQLGKFRLARGDQPVAHVLVGREQEQAVLLQTFQQAAAGSTVFLLIEGPAGIGKTALVEDFREALPAGVLFAEGVDNEAQQHIPYRGLRQALSALLRRLLAQNSQDFAAWRHRLQDALGTTAGVLGDLIPELEQLLGPQPAPADLAPTEQRERLHDAMGAFLAELAGGGAPMVLFLDNLHWSGQPTLDLLPHLVTPRPGQALLVVGALCTEDAGLNDALEDTLARMASSGVELHRLAFAPLSVDAVAEVAARSLGDHPARTQALARWLHRQTSGNPLHVGELLTTLIHEDVLTPPDETPGASWRWDPAGAALSDDLAALLARHLHSLTPATQSALTAGAHMGASFTLCDLALVQGCEQTEAAALLAPAVQDGILLALDAAGRPVSDAGTAVPAAYRSRHDRIAEAAVALTPEAERPALHLRIGRALLGAGPLDGGRVLEVASHLNAGSALMVDSAERLRLAELNLAAGRANRAVSAFAEAWENTRCGLELLPGDAWQAHYNLALALHVEGAAIAPLAGQPVAPLAEPVLANARIPLDAVKAYHSLILAAAADGRFDEALHLGNRALAALGETPLPLSPSRLDVLLSYVKTRAMLWGKSMDDLRNAPPATDPHAIAVERILSAMLESFQVQYRDLAIALAVLRIVQRTQAVGRSPLSAYGYMAYATLLTEGMGNVGAAIEYGQLALDLAETDGSPWLQNRVQLIWFATLAHLVQPLSGTLDPLRQVSRRALAIGDATTAIIAALIYAQHVTTALDDYGVVLEELHRMGEGVAWQGRDALALDFMIELQFLQNLMGQSPDPVQLAGDTWDESSIHERLAGHDNTAFLGSYHVLKATLAYLHHDYARALEHADAGRDGLARFASLYAYPTSLTIDSLIRLAMAPLVSGGRRRQLLRQVAANQHRMAKMVRQMPANLDHFYFLVEAERARVSGRTDEAGVLFERAIQRCQEQGFPPHEAAANECFGRMLLNEGKAEEARRRLSRSRDLYRQIGAQAKASQMNRVYAQWLDPESSAEEHDEAPPAVAAPALDRLAGPDPVRLLQSVTETIAYETAPDALLSRLMTTVLTHMEATRVVLLSREPSTAEFAFEAECARNGQCVLFNPLTFFGGELGDGPAPVRVLNFAANTAEPLLIKDAGKEQPFARDPTIRARGIQAVLCLPLRRQGALIGLLYLENDRASGVFGEADIPLLTLVATQAILVLENARLSGWGEHRPQPKPDEAAAAPAGGPLAEMERRLHAGDWAGAAASFDAAQQVAAETGDLALWRGLSLAVPSELMVLPGGLRRLVAVRRADEALAPPEDATWQRARIGHTAVEAWLRGRLTDVIAIGHDAQDSPAGYGDGGVRLFDPPCLAAAAHTARREYDAGRACLDLALAQLPAGSSGRDAWLGLAIRRARLYWLLGALPRLASLLREIEAAPARLASPLAPALLPALRGVLALEQAEDLAEAERCLSEAVSFAARMPAVTLLVRPDLHLARVHGLAGRHEEAEALVDAALAEVRRTGAPGLIVLEGAAVIPLLRSAAQRGREGPAAARVLAALGVSNVTRRLLIPENGVLLSPREVDVLELVAADASNRAIAERLDVDMTTVKSHVTRVLAKLGVRTRYEAAERAKALSLGPDSAP